mgnify:CR=1 FL=1
MKKYVCDVCGWEYDPAVGVPEAGIPAGTAFEDLPEDFECPLCSVGKDEFSPVEKKKKKFTSIILKGTNKQ